MVKGNHIKWFCIEVRYFHPRGSHRHPGHRDPDHIGALGEQTFDLLHGHMPFDNIAIHDGGVAGLEFSWDLIFGFDLVERGTCLFIDIETVLYQILDPIPTAASSGRVIYGYRMACLDLLDPSLTTTAGSKKGHKQKGSQ
jgi:hypothetical protein